MDYKQYYKRPDSIDTVIKYDFDTQDIISLIKRVDKDAAEKRYSKRFAKRLRGKDDLETCYNVWKFIKTNIRYIADPSGHEKVKSPHQTIQDGYGDCKSMSLLGVDLLRELGIDADYMFVAWKPFGEVQHVYIVTTKGIIIDAVHTRFNEEVKPFFNAKIVKMSKLSWIKGINTDNHLDSPLFTQRPFLNYHLMTEGDMFLHIQMEQLKLAEVVYPNSPNRKFWRKNIDLINNTLFAGLHSVRGIAWTPANDPVSMDVKRVIAYAQKNFTSASGILDLSRRRNPNSNGISGIDPAIQSLDLDIDFESCLRNESHTDPTTGEYTQNDWIDTVCNKQMTYKKAINEKWETGSHHFIYEFLKNPNQYPPVVAAKWLEHQKIVPETAKVSGLSNTNLREWSALGVARANAAKQLGLMNPEATIQQLYLGRNKDENEHIGFDPATIMLILAIISVATPALAGLIQTLKNQEPTAFQYMEKSFGSAVAANYKDFSNGKKGKEGDYLGLENPSGGGGKNPSGGGGGNPSGGDETVDDNLEGDNFIEKKTPNSFLDGMTTGEKVGAGVITAGILYALLNEK